MKSFIFWQRWLLAAAVLITAFGVFMALFSAAPVFELFNRQIDPAFWPEAPDAAARRFQQWVYGVWGSTVAGWGVFIAVLAARPFRQKERWARTCLLAGLGLWYTLDSGLSALYGVYFNVALNTLLLAAAGLPVIFTWKEFEGG